MLMFVAGLEVDIQQIRAQFKQAASISMMGIIIPFSIGFGMVWGFYDFLFSTPTTNIYIPAMFFGTALSITALSVIAKVLMDLNILKSKIGNLILTAAMIDDFLGWILFSIIMQMLNPIGNNGSFASIGYVLLFVLFMMTIGKWIVHKMLRIAKKFFTPPGGVITLSISLCFLGAVYRIPWHTRNFWSIHHGSCCR
jgi:Kef-type K+ transport system membrane component KefB